MSCNGCRVLRRGCSENCILRPCLEWIETPQAQANATLFVSKFFGRSDLMSFISNVPESKRPALFHSLLFEACGRTVNPVNGAVGLLSSGNWHICQAAVETVLSGGVLRPMTVAGAGVSGGGVNHCMGGIINNSHTLNNSTTASFGQSRSEMTTTSEESMMSGSGKEPKLLNLFA